jgi:hypothetical protein
MEKLYLLKLFQESGEEGIKERGRRGELRYDMLDTL